MFDIPRLFAEVDMQELGYRTFLTDRRLISLPRTSMQLIKQLLLQSIKERKKVVTSHVQKNAMLLTTQPLAMQILPLNS